MSMKHLLTLADLSRDEVRSLLELGHAIKKNPGDYARVLERRTLAMVFEKPSTRTRVSFEVAMYQLGGTGLFLSKNDLQLGRGETVADTARVLSRYVDGIMARVFSHQTLLDLAEHATVPVINGLSDATHPCQALADYMTIQEVYGMDLAGRKLAYVGDANNVYRSLVWGGIHTGMSVSIAAPGSHRPDPTFLDEARRKAQEAGVTLDVFEDPKQAVAGADIVYTDVWTSMGQEAEEAERKAALAPYQVNRELMTAAGSQARFMHCLPAHRGDEVTDEVADSEASIIFDQAENRLHAQKAILVHLMGQNP